MAKHYKSFVDFIPIEQNHVFVDDAFAFEFFDALVDCSNGEIEF